MLGIEGLAGVSEAALQQAKTRLEEDPEHSAKKLHEWIKEKLEYLTPQIAYQVAESL